MKNSKKIKSLRYYDFSSTSKIKIEKMIKFYAQKCEVYSKKIKENEEIKEVFYSSCVSAFDIETTTIQDGYNDNGNPKGFAFMYHWQYCLMNTQNKKQYIIITGRYWEEYQKLCEIINNTFKGIRLLCFVHNFAYEFQFMRRFFKWDNVFSKDVRKPIKALSGFIEYRCSYFLSNMSLSKFCENSKDIRFIKTNADFDYNIKRYPNTVLTNKEKFYCLNDVYSLCECVISKMLDFDDNTTTIPLTSTGYVRRILRRNVFKNYKQNRNLFLSSKIDLFLYDFLKDTFRGGNCHANRFYSNSVVENAMSFDRASSYPAVLLMNEYPYGSFNKIEFNNKNQFEYYLEKYALLLEIDFYDLKLKNGKSIPYIPTSKCMQLTKENTIFDNGRILECDYCKMRLTEIDFKIIQNTYDFDYKIVNSFYAYKKYLSREFLEVIFKFYEDKTNFKNIDGMEYEYAKSKNLLNSCFGVFVTDLLNDDIIYNGEFERIRKTNDKRKDDLTKYFESRNNFLNYQIGVWCTAYARLELQKAIDYIDLLCEKEGRTSDMIYCDTDSVKCRYNKAYIKFFEDYNKKLINIKMPYDLKNYAIDKFGEKQYLGIYDNEGNKEYIAYLKFATLGSKKYCYISSKDNKLHITVSGLSKYCVKELKNINEFKIGKIFKGDKKHPARTIAYYCDDYIHKITFNGITFTTASSIGIFDTTYTLGISKDYLELLENL